MYNNFSDAFCFSRYLELVCVIVACGCRFNGKKMTPQLRLLFVDMLTAGVHCRVTMAHWKTSKLNAGKCNFSVVNILSWCYFQNKDSFIQNQPPRDSKLNAK